MEDNIYTLKSDIQECVVNNVDLNSDYRLLLYEGNSFNLIQALGCFEELEISPKGTLMNFKGKIANDLTFSEEEIANIKGMVWKKNVMDALKQKADSKKTDIEKLKEKVATEEFVGNLVGDFFEEISEQEHKYAAISESDEKVLKLMRKEFKKMGLDLDYEERETSIMLSSNFSYLSLEKKELRKIVDWANKVDMILIAPVYSDDEEDNDCKAIRIVFAIGKQEM